MADPGKRASRGSQVAIRPKRGVNLPASGFDANDVSLPSQQAMRLEQTRNYLHRRGLTIETNDPLRVVDFGEEFLISSTIDTGSTEYLWDRGDAVIRAYRRLVTSDYFHITISAATYAVIANYRRQIGDLYQPRPLTKTEVRCAFWYMGGAGPLHMERHLAAPTWDEVAPNYSRAVRSHIATLTDETWRPDEAGRMLLWYGPPGTGKTYAIRSLVRAWAPWCEATYITDVDQFLGSSQYMMQVLMGGSSPSYTGVPKKSWQLIILEDAGELLTADARGKVGQGLGRLLNITDGFVGQGLGVLVLVTTNEDYTALHEAVIRPGRCMSQIPFGPLDEADARVWLESRGYRGDAAKSNTLAELYATVRGDTGRLVTEERRKVGFGIS